MNEIIHILLERSPLGVLSFFMIGVLIIILIQNAFFYLSYKDKAYLWYSIYALIILIDQILINYFVYYYNKDSSSSLYFFKPLHPALEWLYNSAYLIFVVELGGLYLLRSKTARILKNVVYFSAGMLIILFSIDVTYENNLVRIAFLYLQVPMLIILSIVIYYHLFQMKTNVKYYIIPGSLAFSIFSILALLNSLTHIGSSQLSWAFFYIGVFIEYIFFSLGLVVKQKIVLNERNISQKELINQLKENQDLKNKMTLKLQDEVTKKTTEIVLLHKQAESERIKKLALSFEKEIAELKVSSLQNQMNPHFIFNCLNSIKLYIIKEDNENAVYYLNKFSKLIRKILSASREKVVSLKEEIDTIALYINIENIRFRNEILFTLVIDESINLSTIKIPPLILQPFIENAIWHGLSLRKDSKKLRLTIEKLNTTYIKISILDNGIGRVKSEEIKNKKLHKKESIGLKLTEERLIHFSKNFKNNYKLNFNDLSENGKSIGTEVVINLPII